MTNNIGLENSFNKNNTSASKRYHHGDLYNALISAGSEILSVEGIAGLDLRKVARRVGVSHAAPYRHFTDKQALLAAIAERGFGLLLNAIQTGLSRAGTSTHAQLEALSWAYVSFALDNPTLLREMFSGLTIHRETYPTLYAISKQSFALLIQVVQNGQRLGEVGAGDPSEISVTVWSMLHGLAMLLIEDQIPIILSNEAVIVQLVQGCVDKLYNGLKA